jgi:hypothetical protein
MAAAVPPKGPSAALATLARQNDRVAHTAGIIKLAFVLIVILNSLKLLVI